MAYSPQAATQRSGSSEPSSPYISPVATRPRQGALTSDGLPNDVLSHLTLPMPKRRGAVSGASGPALPFPPLQRPPRRDTSRGPSPSAEEGPELPRIAPLNAPPQRRGAIAAPGFSSLTRSNTSIPGMSSMGTSPFQPGYEDSRTSHDGVPAYAPSGSGLGPSASIPASWTDLRRSSRGSAPPLDNNYLASFSTAPSASAADGIPPTTTYQSTSSYPSSAAVTAGTSASSHVAYVSAAYSPPPSGASFAPMHVGQYGNPTAGLGRPAWQPTMTAGPSMHNMYAPSGLSFDVAKPRPRSGPRIDSDVPRNFRCQYAGCPARFQRNHDLKRHQRGHLATRPFSCSCGKSFSRKDALKRHMLVKGCGHASRRDGAGGKSQERDAKRSNSQGPDAGPEGEADDQDDLDEGEDQSPDEERQDMDAQDGEQYGRHRGYSGSSTHTSSWQDTARSRMTSAPQTRAPLRTHSSDEWSGRSSQDVHCSPSRVESGSGSHYATSVASYQPSTSNYLSSHSTYSSAYDPPSSTIRRESIASLLNFPSTPIAPGR
ncbi:FOG: Zn-finger [Ceraceosorus bombacis]|uniref:FOG: Zn-finger n=2 Tax=Ceraceosorus TaxID=401624 RepID=A0A0P1BBV5_9BASI|nr:FOG: Zn-finger [Ceraceosorus bombacis]